MRLAVYSEVQVAELEASADRAAGIVASDADVTDFDDTPVLWLLPPSGDISLKPQKRSAAMDIGPTDSGDFASSLSQNLVTIFRATGLSRLSQANTFKPKDFNRASPCSPPAAKRSPIRAGIDAHRAARRSALRRFRQHLGQGRRSQRALYRPRYGITLLCQAHLAHGEKLFQPMADLND